MYNINGLAFLHKATPKFFYFKSCLFNGKESRFASVSSILSGECV